MTLRQQPPAGNREADGGQITFSVVVVTFARDEIASAVIKRVHEVSKHRRDVEFILVDNNADDLDRTAMAAIFARYRYLKMGRNKGVSARNDGAAAARGDFILFVDDDAFLNPDDALECIQSAFRDQPRLAIVTARHIDASTGRTPRASFPHTNKKLPQDRPFKTFRFQGNGFCMRRAAFTEIGPMSEDYFYGMEEIDYAYRVVDRGWEILYEPAVWVIEHNHPGGRRPTRLVQEDRLRNKMIISYKYMPFPYWIVNFVMFSAYLFLLNKGQINPFRSFRGFLSWRAKNPTSRRPISAQGRDYIARCGGAVWK